jgi:hypothetical protein
MWEYQPDCCRCCWNAFTARGLKNKRESVCWLLSLSRSFFLYDRTEPRALAALTGTGVAKGSATQTRISSEFTLFIL